MPLIFFRTGYTFSNESYRQLLERRNDMAEMYNEAYEGELFITEGLDDEVERYNQLEDGTEKKLNAAKALQIRHGLGIEEFKAGQQAEDMAERRQLERERLELERVKTEAEAEERAMQARAEAKREKFRNGVAIGGFIFTGALQIIGLVLDHGHAFQDTIRNRNAENEAKDTRRALERLTDRIANR